MCRAYAQEVVTLEEIHVNNVGRALDGALDVTQQREQPGAPASSSEAAPLPVPPPPRKGRGKGSSDYGP